MRATTQCGASAVHGGVAATDHHHDLARLGILRFRDPLQIANAGPHSLGVLALQIHRGGRPGTDSQIDRVEVVLQILQSQVRAQ